VLEERHLLGRQGRLLFAYLIVEQGKSVPRDKLAEALWEGVPPASWESALRGLVSKLRKVLADTDGGSSKLTGALGGYRLELPAGTWVDVSAAERAMREAEDLLGAGELDRAISQAALAESLLREPFMPGEDGTWVRAKRRELEGVRVRALNVLAEACRRSGKAEASVAWAEQAVEIEPFRESGYRQLMAAHEAAGNRAEALRVYDRCRRLLAKELGAYPSPETEAVYRHLLEEPATGREPATGGRAHRSAHAAPARPDSAVSGSRIVAGSSDRLPRFIRRKPMILFTAALVLAAAIAAAVALVSRGGSAPTVLPNTLIRIDPRTLQVTRVVPVEGAPDLVMVSGGYLWVTNHILRDRGSGAPRNAGDHTLTRVDPTTGKAAVVGGGLAPCGMTPDPSGDVWVANCYPTTIPGLRDDVVRVDARTLVFKKTLPAPGGDGFFRGLAYGGGSLWLSQIVGGDIPNSDTVTQINPETGKQRTIELAREASGLAWSGGYGDLWIANFFDGSLTRLHTATGSTESVGGVAAAPAFPILDGSVVWVADWSDPQVARLNAIGPVRLRRISLPGGDAGVWSIAAGAGAVWATSPRDGAVWRIEPATGKATRLNLPYLPTGVTTDANDVWVTVRGR
jgi:DNA-binding SARP family transcriptional activator/streptogramin lyase